MTPQEIITAARVLINDDNPLMPERFSDAELLGFVNQAVKRACILRPDLFVITDALALTANSTGQTLDSSITRLMEIHRVYGGAAIGEVDKETMDRSYPNWTTQVDTVPVNWMRHTRDPRRFYVYPAASTAIAVIADYVKVPDDYELTDTIDLPDSYKTAIIDCVVFLAEIMDNENVETPRAKGFYESFVQSLGADLSMQSYIDTEPHPGVPQQQARRNNNNA